MAPLRHNQVVFLARDRSSVEPWRQHLRCEGYAAVTISEPGGSEAIFLRAPDLVVLDWHLPSRVLEAVRHYGSRSGFALFVLFRATSPPPIEEAFEFGADDCIQIPFSMREATARVHALMQRRQDQSACVWICDGIRIDMGTLRATANGTPVRLSVLQLRLLEFFMRNQGLCCPRALLLKEVWGSACLTGARGIDVYVQRLRQLLRAGGCHDYIRTIRGKGYQFVPTGQRNLELARQTPE